MTLVSALSLGLSLHLQLCTLCWAFQELQGEAGEWDRQGREGEPLCILGLPSPGPSWCLEHGFVLRQGYVTSWAGQAGHVLNLVLSPLSLLPSRYGAVALADLFFKLQG